MPSDALVDEDMLSDILANGAGADLSLKLLKDNHGQKIEIRLPHADESGVTCPTAPTGSPSTASNTTSATKGSKRKHEDMGEKEGLYTIPTCNGEKLPMKIVNPEKVTTRMRDVGGYEEAKLEVIEFVNFIKNPEQYIKLGARLPKGAILYGQPGTGKTLLARAIAGEANVPFISCNAAEFLMDDGVEKLANVFDKAREMTPCVLFFDEIDCIGRSRDEYYVNQQQALLEEMLCQLDGFVRHEDSKLIVIGATNRLYMMDGALLRPGRFDRTIAMNEPNLAARYSIFMVHLRPLTTSLDKKEISKKMSYLSGGFTGAKIATACNEAAMIAARDLNDEIRMEHFEQGLDRVREGIGKKIVLSECERKYAAYHDAGHGVFGWFSSGGVDPPAKLNLLQTPDGHQNQARCSQYSIRNCNTRICTRESLEVLMMMTLAGKATEEHFLGDSTSMCEKDLEDATYVALCMVCNYGMSEEVGPVALSGLNPWRYNSDALCPLDEAAKGMVLKELKRIINKAYKDAKEFVAKRSEEVEKLANALLKNDMLHRDDMKAILGERPFPDAPIFIKDENEESFLPEGLQQWNASAAKCGFGDVIERECWH